MSYALRIFVKSLFQSILQFPCFFDEPFVSPETAPFRPHQFPQLDKSGIALQLLTPVRTHQPPSRETRIDNDGFGRTLPLISSSCAEPLWRRSSPALKQLRCSSPQRR